MADDRLQIAQRVAELARRGICPACHDLETGEPYGRGDRAIYEDERFLVVLERFPRMTGHTIVLFKPHRDDFTELTAEESGEVMSMCVRVARALTSALGAERVYLNTMCDGTTHLHLQLFPRYAEDEQGSRRFVLPRGELHDGAEVAQRVRRAFDRE